MIKKLVFGAAILAVVALTSCSGKSPEDYAKESYELSLEYMDALKAGDTEKYQALAEKENKLNNELDEKFRNDPKFKEEFLKAFDQYQDQFVQKFGETINEITSQF